MNLLRLLLLYMMLLTGTSTMKLGATPIPYAAMHTPTPVPTAVPTPEPTPTPTPSPVPTPSPTPRLYVLASGSAGASVRKLQARLQELGYLSEDPDGFFGPKTEAAVKLFQEVNGLKVDGVAGQITQEKLYYDAAALPAPTASPEPAVSETPAAGE